MQRTARCCGERRKARYKHGSEMAGVVKTKVTMKDAQ